MIRILEFTALSILEFDGPRQTICCPRALSKLTILTTHNSRLVVQLHSSYRTGNEASPHSILLSFIIIVVMTRVTLSVLAVLAVLVAIIVKIGPGQHWPHQQYPSSATYSAHYDNNDIAIDNNNLIRFPGGDGSTTLSGRLFPPHYAATAAATTNTTLAPPLVILAHGLGLSQDCSLEPFVDAFQKAGFAAFTFDYATFGASEGYPRHQVKPHSHIADLHAAIRMIRTNAKELKVDADRIGLWGTSLGGGHALMVASQDLLIKASVAQVPHTVSGTESVIGMLQRDFVNASLGLVKFLASLIQWTVHRIIYQQTIYIPLHGLPASAAIMQNPGDDGGYSSLIPPNGGLYGWRNLATVMSALHILVYRPINHVASIQSPLFLIAAEHDTLCSLSAIQRASELIPKSELLVLPGLGHFDIYHGEPLQKILTATVAFFKKHLL